MLTVVLIMLAGICFGYLFRTVPFLKHINRFIFLAILILLFLMGTNLGADKSIADNIAVIGKQAVVIAAFATGGSLFAAWILWKSVFKGNGNER